jgi:hypothetical protein
MANTIKVTNRTIEISNIDSDYFTPQLINIESVILLQGKFHDNYAYIVENDINGDYPIKAKLISTDGEPRVWYTYQRLQLGFTVQTSSLGNGARVIFNIGELKGA